MEWLTDFFSNWELLSTVIGWIVGIVGISYFTFAWQVMKNGRAMYKTYYENKEDGWTEAEKDEYIAKSAEFFQSLKSLWNAIFKKSK